jgi:hypothetical protein
MGCIIALAGAFFPRLVIVILVVAGDYIGRAYETWIWPLLGFFFMPCTTLAYAIARNEGGGLQGWFVALFVVAILLDLGFIGGGSDSVKKRRRPKEAA